MIYFIATESDSAVKIGYTSTNPALSFPIGAERDSPR
jgi:hypothetical protein